MITAVMLITRIMILSFLFDSLTELPVFKLYFWIILFLHLLLIIIVPDLITIAANNNSDITIAGPTNIVTLLSAAGAGCLMITIVIGIALGVCYCKKSQAGKKYCNELQCIPF